MNYIVIADSLKKLILIRKKKNLLLTAVATLGLTAATMAQNVPSYVPTSGLVGWWPFNGNANDESGNGNNGTVNGATLTSDRNGTSNAAFNFDGVNDYIQANNPLGSMTSDFTISSFVKIATWQGGLFVHVGIDQNQFPRDGFGYGYGGSQAVFNGQNLLGLLSNVNWYVSGYQFGNSSIWYHACVVRINNILTYYINGVLVGSNTISTISPPSNALFFGSGATQYANFNGSLDDIGIWNRALTQQEITDLYNGCQLSLTTQPSNQTININNMAQFVTSSSDPSATYQWQTDLGVGFQNLNSVGQYSGTTNDTLTVSTITMSNNNQPFRCIVSSGSCSDTSNVAVLTVNNNVGINEPSQDNLFSIFPNPAQNKINVRVGCKLIGQVYFIFDNTGRAVLTGKINSENTTIELGNLSGGIYTISVGDNLNQSFKVIKE